MNKIVLVLLCLGLSACAPFVRKGTNIDDYDYTLWDDREAEARSCGRAVKRNHSFRKGSGFALQDFTKFVAHCMAQNSQQSQIVGSDANNPRVSSFTDGKGRTMYQTTCNYSNETACYRAASNACGGGKYKVEKYEMWGNGVQSVQSGNGININIQNNINIGYGNTIYANKSKQPQYIRSTWACN